MKKKSRSNPVLFTAILLILLIAGMSCTSKEEQSLYIAAGAGYKKPLMEITTKFTDATGIQVFPIFGNMQAVSTQVKQSGQVGVLIGDKTFLENPTLGINYNEYESIGEGKLVLAYPLHGNISGISSLTDINVEKISMPDTKKAIYGKAAYEFLQSAGLWNELEPKILIASTVPQVSSYLIAEEIDAGFINLTDAIAIKDQIGGYYLLEEGAPRIEIVAGVVDTFQDNPEVRLFISYLKEADSLKILESYGL